MTQNKCHNGQPIATDREMLCDTRYHAKMSKTNEFLLEKGAVILWGLILALSGFVWDSNNKTQQMTVQMAGLITQMNTVQHFMREPRFTRNDFSSYMQQRDKEQERIINALEDLKKTVRQNSVALAKMSKDE